jgi:peptide/nickel transport system substrate-binding protein
LGATAGVTLLLITAACGGGGGSKKAASGQDVTTTTEAPTSTTAAGSTDSTVAGATPTTAASSSSGGSTATTAKKSSTASKSTATTAKVSQVGGSTPIKGGITNVTAPASTAPPSDLQIGGTLTLLKATDPQGFDPIVSTASQGSDAPTSFAVFGALVYSDLADGTVKPLMADGLTSTDAIVWTLKLHPNMKFTDGTPYDAAAVKFNWQRLQDPNNHAPRYSGAISIASMDVVDPLTLKLTLKTKNAVFPQTVALMPFIGSPTAIQQKGSGFNSDPVGAGPFMLKQWIRDSSQTFVRNPNYFDAPRPYVDTLIYKTIGDESPRFNSLQAGQGDIMWTVTTQTAEQARKAGFVETAGVQNGGPDIYFNMRAGKQFADKRARQAVTEAIDRCDLVKTVLNGVVDCSDSIFRHSSPFYDPNILQPAYNPTHAQDLFNQLAAENGGTYKITFTTFTYGNFPAEAQYIQAKLNSYKNVKVDLVSEATNLHITNVLSGNFDMTDFSNPFDDPEPTWTSQYICTNPSNPTGYCNKDFDAAVDKGKVTLDPNERAQAMKDAQKLLYADMPAFYFERRVTWHFSNAQTQNIHLVGDGFILVDRVWKKS